MDKTARWLPVGLVAAAVITATYFVWMPGIVDSARGTFPMRLGGLGLGSVISAFVCVEIAALAVPAWRGLRTTGQSGRALLNRRAEQLALFFGLLQGIALHRSYEQLDALSSAGWILVPTVVSVTALHIALARAINRAGGPGWAVLVTADLAMAMATTEWAWPSSEASLVVVLAAIGTTVVLVMAHRSEARAAQTATPDEWALPSPASGIVPLTVAATVLVWMQMSGATGPVRLLAALAALGVTTALLSLLFNLPSRVGAVWATATETDPSSRVPVSRRALAGAILRTSLLFGALTAVALLVGHPMSAVVVAVLVQLVAFGVDVADEVAFRAEHGEVEVADELTRVYAVPAARLLLHKAGIPTLARGRHLRATLQFFGPHLPIALLVPPGQAQAARTALAPLYRSAGAQRSPTGPAAS